MSLPAIGGGGGSGGGHRRPQTAPAPQTQQAPPRKKMGSLDENALWVQQSAARFQTCLQSTVSGSRKTYVSQWYSGTLTATLSKLHELEETLYEVLAAEPDDPAGGDSSMQTPEVEAKLAAADNPAVAALRLGTQSLVGLAAGASHSLLLSDSGHVLAFGKGTHGCLGTGEGGNSFEPYFLRAVRDIRVMQVAAGQSHTLLLADTGAVFGLGCNECGQLGTGDRRSAVTPVEVRTGGLPIAQLAAGAHFSLYLTEDGRILSSGYGSSGQLGHGSKQNELTPKCIEAREFGEASSVAAGADHSLVVMKNGELFSFGKGFCGATGLGHERDVLEPHRVGGFEGFHVLEAAGGSAHSLVMARDQSGFVQVLSFGLGHDGQLGHGDNGDRWSPEVVVSLSELVVVQVCAGNRHSLVRTESGNVLAFGAGAHGKLGLGSTASKVDPISIPELEGRVCLVASGGDHNIALDQDGRCFTWGSSRCGQLGQGSDLPLAKAPQEILLIRKQELTGKKSAADEAKARETAREKALNEKLRAARSREEGEKEEVRELKKMIADLSEENTDQRTKNKNLLAQAAEMRRTQKELEEKLWMTEKHLTDEERESARRRELAEDSMMGAEGLRSGFQAYLDEVRFYRGLEERAKERSLTCEMMLTDYDAFRREADATEFRLNALLEEAVQRRSDCEAVCATLREKNQRLVAQHETHDARVRSVLEECNARMAGTETQRLAQQVLHLQQRLAGQSEKEGMMSRRIESLVQEVKELRGPRGRG
eukprot:CAMPEP_0119492348 /NCGR_PEP_ID=MMETSP1344-20130328/16917_1 /TAXON_ID=236787 /ORGANISM="Florenciella parvula, Strain CCMP2471" /LENGTH=764 /DNA_ID=CAMNT_0007527671 /DNA_START=8 /DNA_END=2302 /DNA_ORIENTATION=-